MHGHRFRKQSSFVDVELNGGDTRYDVERMEITINNLRQQLDISRNREKRLATALEISGYQVKLDAPDNESENLTTFSSFFASYLDRGSWLVGLLIFQSFSSIILQSNEDLLKNHPTIIQYLTMLIGAGGNAGSQATVRVIRGIAIGSLNKNTTWKFILSELYMGAALCITVGIAGVVRTLVTGHTSVMETLAIAVALCVIVMVSIIAGVMLPLGFQFVGLDPAHSSTSIQVFMDIAGVLIICTVSSLLLESTELDLNELADLSKLIDPSKVVDAANNLIHDVIGDSESS